MSGRHRTENSPGGAVDNIVVKPRIKVWKIIPKKSRILLDNRGRN